MDRISILLKHCSRDGKGLEIGPSYNPVAPKKEGFNVETVDYISEEDLRKIYANKENCDASKIEKVDYIWESGMLHDLIGRESFYDWIIASHVIEHLPDPLSFLVSCSHLLKKNGILSLAIPDKRYCFDYFRWPNSTGDFLQACEEKRTLHNISSIYDNFAYSCKRNEMTAWGQDNKGEFSFNHKLEDAALQLEKRAKEELYINVHAWCFTPSSFRLILLELQLLKKIDFFEMDFTETTGCEFFITLRKLNDGDVPDSSLRLELCKKIIAEISEADESPKLKSSEKSDEEKNFLSLLFSGFIRLSMRFIQVLATDPLSLPSRIRNKLFPPRNMQIMTDISHSSQNSLVLDQYLKEPPSDENTINVFKGEWTSIIPGIQTGGFAALFDDNRIKWFAECYGGFKGKSVLELGPLEGGHTYMLCKAGADPVIAIESNQKAFLKCLITKEIMGHSAKILLGDFTQYLENTTERFDFVLASGVLYHMIDPVNVLENISKVSNHIGIWTHYYDKDVINSSDNLRKKFDGKNEEVCWRNHVFIKHRYNYFDALNWGGFCGGSNPFSYWLTRDDILLVMRELGFDVKIGIDHIDHPNGPSLLFYAYRSLNLI
ncbi:MAG: methyltransferase domain-containing protein [Nitrospiraceae bacterium]|nr:methyltransferase domain-containing protein [Nitrospiraceae bacterium]